MRYLGYFSLLFTQERRHYCVEFYVDEFDTPGGCLRRIAQAAFEEEGASGLSLESTDLLSSESADCVVSRRLLGTPAVQLPELQRC